MRTMFICVDLLILLASLLLKLSTSEGWKPVLDSIPVTEQVETLSIFYIRTETCAQFNLDL